MSDLRDLLIETDSAISHMHYRGIWPLDRYETDRLIGRLRKASEDSSRLLAAERRSEAPSTASCSGPAVLDTIPAPNEPEAEGARWRTLPSESLSEPLATADSGSLSTDTTPEGDVAPLRGAPDGATYPSRCPACRGTGGGAYNDCPTCDGNGEV